MLCGPEMVCGQVLGLHADAASASGEADVPRPDACRNRADGLWGHCKSGHALQLREHAL